LYFGSVKFFKHLIVIVVVLLIIASIALAIVLSIENKDLKSRLDSEQPIGTQPSDTAGSPSATDSEPSATTSKNQPDSTQSLVSQAQWPPEPHGSYAEVLPNMYAVKNLNSPDISYTNDKNHIYLTFDDGPNYHTSSILDYLKKSGVKATFFVSPHSNSKNSLKRIVDEGHTIAIHCYSHEYKDIYKNVTAYLEDFNKARNMIHNQTGLWIDIYRFPGGSINNHNEKVRDDIFDEMNRRGFVYFDWNVDSKDTAGANYDSMLRNVPENTKESIEDEGRAVVLFHDSGNHTSWVIEDIIKKLKNMNKDYTFSAIDENVRPMQW